MRLILHIQGCGKPAAASLTRESRLQSYQLSEAKKHQALPFKVCDAIVINMGVMHVYAAADALWEKLYA
jgi:hypothetical protein